MLRTQTVFITFVALFILAGYSVKRDCPRTEKYNGFIIEIDRKCNVKNISIDKE